MVVLKCPSCKNEVLTILNKQYYLEQAEYYTPAVCLKCGEQTNFGKSHIRDIEEVKR